MTVLSWFQKPISGSRTTTDFYPEQPTSAFSSTAPAGGAITFTSPHNHLGDVTEQRCCTSAADTPDRAAAAAAPDRVVRGTAGDRSRA